MSFSGKYRVFRCAFVYISVADHADLKLKRRKYIVMDQTGNIFKTPNSGLQTFSQPKTTLQVFASTPSLGNL